MPTGDELMQQARDTMASSLADVLATEIIEKFVQAAVAYVEEGNGKGARGAFDMVGSRMAELVKFGSDSELLRAMELDTRYTRLANGQRDDADHAKTREEASEHLVRAACYQAASGEVGFARATAYAIKHKGSPAIAYATSASARDFMSAIYDCNNAADHENAKDKDEMRAEYGMGAYFAKRGAEAFAKAATAFKQDGDAARQAAAESDRDDAKDREKSETTKGQNVK